MMVTGERVSVIDGFVVSKVFDLLTGACEEQRRAACISAAGDNK